MIKPTNLKQIKKVVANLLTFIIFMTIYLKEKHLQLFIYHIKVLLKMGTLTKKKNKSNDIGDYTIKLIKK